jgi:hypothetical protein
MNKKIKRFLQGKTKAGQVFHGVIDALPFPNILTPVRAVLNEVPDAKLSDIAKRSFDKMDKIRLAVGLTISFLIISGKITPETAEQIIDLLLKLF